MAGCLELINATMIAGTQDLWGSVDRSALKGINITSYLRPDTGAALLPWVYTMIALIIHAPVIFVRVTRWEAAQTWCIVSTFFVIIIYVQAFISTKFAADQILVWTPLILIIDASSMLQIFFLVFETQSVRYRGRTILFDPADQEEGRRNLLRRLPRWLGYTETVEQGFQLVPFAPNLEPEPGNNNNENHPIDEAQDGNNQVAHPDHAADDAIDHQPQPVVEHVQMRQDPAIYAAIASALLFVVIFILQCLRLHAAIVARKGGKSPLVSWCSPTFQPFGVAIVDGDCHVYQINQSLSRGIGCIQIPGVWQRQWLTGTVVGTGLSLALEIIDLIILSLVRGDQRWRGMKMKRPWTTMICGVVILAITLFYGIQYASMLPPGITERVNIAVNVNGTKAFNAQLASAGLRGTIIGWNDGLFESWKGVYTGSVLH